MSPRKPPLIGQKYERLTVLSYLGALKKYLYFVEVRCDCGVIFQVSEQDLKSGNTKSCGCLKKEIISKRRRNSTILDRPMHKIPGFYSWRAMKVRCLDPEDPAYPSYGGRGITICDRWLEFPNFYADMGEKPKGLSIDRIDNNGNYEPGNCRWATSKQQCSNKRNNRHVVLRNRKITIHEAHKILGYDLGGVFVIMKRLNCSLQEAFDLYLLHRRSGRTYITYEFPDLDSVAHLELEGQRQQ